MLKILSSIILIFLNIQQYQTIVSKILPSVSIFEESPLSSTIIDLQSYLNTIDFQSGYYSTSSIILLQSQTSAPFEYINGTIRLKSRLDREEYCKKRLCNCHSKNNNNNNGQCNFTITLTVNIDTPPYNYILSLPIICIDLNDNAPKFSQLESTIIIAENAPRGHRVPLETATDNDSLEYGIVEYRLLWLNNTTIKEFSINYDNITRELELVVREKLDRENISQYVLKLIAIDRGKPSNFGTQILTIIISDVNDCRPKFEFDVYNISVSENSIPENLIHVKAFDLDSGINSELDYHLDNNYNNLFDIDKLNGIIILKHSLDYEIRQYYLLKVIATDHGVNHLTGVCMVHVFVIDQNDNAPEIDIHFTKNILHNTDSNMAYISESYDILLPFAYINVRDKDSEVNGKAQLFVEPDQFFLKIIKDNYYELKSKLSFDREMKNSYQIELNARDYGTPSLRRSMTFYLNITDINDYRPLFHLSNYSFEIYENNRLPTIIGQVYASDLDNDINGQISYNIISKDKNINNIFSISSIDGIITTNYSFNYEEQKQYIFQVRAIDHGIPSMESLTNIYVNILNINEHIPKFTQNIYHFSIDENSTNNVTYIGQVEAHDLDHSDRITYSFADDNNNLYYHLFSINQSTGIIWTNTILDREKYSQYELTVLAIDNAKNIPATGTSLVQIMINDLNDNYPIFVWPDVDELKHILFNENIQQSNIHYDLSEFYTSQFITDIIVHDADIGNNAKIDLILNRREDQQLFYIGDNNSLWLKNMSIIPGTYEIELIARDHGQPSLETKKLLRLNIFTRDSSFYSFGKQLSHVSLLMIIILSLIATCSTCTVLICIAWKRFRYSQNVKSLYGSHLIVNDEEKKSRGQRCCGNNSGESRPNSTLIDTSNDYAIIVKRKDNNHGNSLSSGEYSTSLCPPIFNGSTSSSEIMEHHNLSKQKYLKQYQSNTVSALTTLTRKSSKRKNVSFDNTDVLDDLFLNRQLLSNGDNSYPSTNISAFSTLPKKNSSFNQPILPELSKKSDFSTLQSLLDNTNKVSTISFIDRTKKPKVPPLLDGISYLDSMLNDSKYHSNYQNRTDIQDNECSGWYKVTDSYTTRASIV